MSTHQRGTNIGRESHNDRNIRGIGLQRGRYSNAQNWPTNLQDWADSLYEAIDRQ